MYSSAVMHHLHGIDSESISSSSSAATTGHCRSCFDVYVTSSRRHVVASRRGEGGEAREEDGDMRRQGKCKIPGPVVILFTTIGIVMNLCGSIILGIAKRQWRDMNHDYRLICTGSVMFSLGLALTMFSILLSIGWSVTEDVQRDEDERKDSVYSMYSFAFPDSRRPSMMGRKTSSLSSQYYPPSRKTSSLSHQVIVDV